MSEIVADHSRESRVRKLVKREGYVLLKSRRYAPPDIYSDYMLVDPAGAPALGFRYDASLDEVERWLRK